MNILNRISLRLLSESAMPCKMFWCIPTPTDDGFGWETVILDSEGDDLSNWLIIMHKLKQAWGKDFDACRECHSSLPRGVCVDNVLYHGNNLPIGVHLEDIAKEMGYSLGNEIQPKYHKMYGINSNDLGILEDILGETLGLQTTQE